MKASFQRSYATQKIVYDISSRELLNSIYNQINIIVTHMWNVAIHVLHQNVQYFINTTAYHTLTQNKLKVVWVGHT